VSGRASELRQRTIQQIIKGAIKAGASGVTVNLVGGPSVVIAFPDKAAPVETAANEWDVDDADKA
jgi:hypothetical protein